MKDHMIKREFDLLVYTTYLKSFSLIPHRCGMCGSRTREYVAHVASVACNTRPECNRRIEVPWYHHHMCHNKACATLECLRERLGSLDAKVREAAEHILRNKFYKTGVSSEVASLHQLAKTLASSI